MQKRARWQPQTPEIAIKSTGKCPAHPPKPVHVSPEPTLKRQSVSVEIGCRGQCRFAIVCGSLGVGFMAPGSDVDERVKAFLGSAALVYQHRKGGVFERCFFSDRLWLGTAPLFSRTRANPRPSQWFTERPTCFRASVLRRGENQLPNASSRKPSICWSQGACPRGSYRARVGAQSLLSN